MAQYESAYTGAEIDSAIGKANNAIAQTINKTWSELITMRDDGTLIPGQWYRITDYVTMVSFANVTSAGHAFDIIIRADETNKLNENAYAALHSGDTYFANSKLQAWELKYCIDNDTNRFSWASISGTGVIYYMRDEWGNECPYDFKNIKFTRKYVTSVSGNLSSFTTFKNCFFAYYKIQSTASTIYPSGVSSTTGQYLFTFSLLSSTSSAPTVTDNSLNGKCYKNRIEPYRFSTNLKYYLNNIVIINTSSTSLIYDNTFEADCSNLTLQGGYQNTFKKNCSNIISLSGSGNSFDTNCNDNYLGSNCSFNAFGIGCHGNYLNFYCSSNVFKGSNIGCKLSDRCSNNSFGCSSSSNIFGPYSSYNSLGENSSGNTTGHNFSDNIIGNSSSGNTFGINCEGNFLGNKCSKIQFGDSCFCNSISFVVNEDTEDKYIIPSGTKCSPLVSFICSYEQDDNDTYKAILYLLSPFDVTLEYAIGVNNSNNDGDTTSDQVTLKANVPQKVEYVLVTDDTDGLVFTWSFYYYFGNNYYADFNGTYDW